MSALLNCAQTAGAVKKNIAKVNFPRIIVSPSKLRRTPTLEGMQFLHNWLKIFDFRPQGTCPIDLRFSRLRVSYSDPQRNALESGLPRKSRSGGQSAVAGEIVTLRPIETKALESAKRVTASVARSFGDRSNRRQDRDRVADS